MRCIPGAVLRTSLIKSEIKWYIHDDIIANQDLANSVLRTHLLLMISMLNWVIWDICVFMGWVKRGYVSIIETTKQGSDWQDSNVMTYH